MKNWKCPNCYREHESKDNIKYVFCSVCLIEMKPSPYLFERLVEVKNG